VRVLITGSRGWRDETVLWDALTELVRDMDPSEVTVVHGGAAGVDQLADRGARELGMRRELHMPIRGDGPDRYRMRNQRMVNAGADLCLAFADRWASGTGMCARMARAAGIRTVDYGVDTETR